MAGRREETRLAQISIFSTLLGKQQFSLSLLALRNVGQGSKIPPPPLFRTDSRLNLCQRVRHLAARLDKTQLAGIGLR